MRTVVQIIRSLQVSPMFAVTVVASLGVGLGCAASIGFVVLGLFFPPPRFAHEEELREIWATVSPQSRVPADYFARRRAEDWSREPFRTASAMAFYGSTDLMLLQNERSTTIRTTIISGQYFEVLDMTARLGRALVPEDDQPAATPAAVLSDAAWKGALGGNPRVLGSQITLSGRSYVVVGVMPEDFERRPMIWIPMAQSGETAGVVPWLGIARLRPGLGTTQMDEELSLKASQESSADSVQYGHHGAAAVRLGAVQRAAQSGRLSLLVACGFCILLVTLVNLASLTYGRTMARERTLAIRLAVGGSTTRVGLLLMGETLALSVIGAGLAWITARWLTVLLGHVVANDGLLAVGSSLFGRASIIVALGLITWVALVSGPLVRLLSLSVPVLLQEGAFGTTTSHGVSVSRRVVVVLQLCMSLVLITVSLTLAKGYQRLRTLDLGYNPDVVEGVPEYSRSDLGPDDQYRLAAAAGGLIRNSAHVDAVGLAKDVILPYPPRLDEVAVLDGHAPSMRAGVAPGAYTAATPGFFAAMGITARRGRLIGPGDGRDDPLVAVVSETAAKMFWPHEEALGQKFRIGPAGQPITVVGVTPDVGGMGRIGRVAASFRPNIPTVFLSLEQAVTAPPGWSDTCPSCDGIVVVVSGASVEETERAITDAFTTVAPTLRLRYLGTIVSRQMSVAGVHDVVVSGLVLSSTALLVSLLSLIGLSAISAQTVDSRRSEFGVRLALGEPPTRLLVRAATDSLATTCLGLVAGLGVVLLLRATLVKTLIPPLLQRGGVDGGDPKGLAVVVAAVLTTALMTAVLGAWKVVRIDPVSSLRAE